MCPLSPPSPPSGSLADVLSNPAAILDSSIMVSVIKNVADGMAYLRK